MKNKEPTFIHIRADGSTCHSMDGVIVPLNEFTLGAYEVLAKYSRGDIQIERKDE